jgi:hypothetical protein
VSFCLFGSVVVGINLGIRYRKECRSACAFQSQMRDFAVVYLPVPISVIPRGGSLN